MTFVPLLGLLPFVFYHLSRREYIFNIFFCTGIFLGSISTFLNLYFSVEKFGIQGLTSLFDFAKKQAIGDIGFNNLLLIPFNFLYLTFPVGLLFLILFVFTRSHMKINYPLLIYCYPLISLILLLSMSTSYPHYYLFLLPSFSMIFASYVTSFSFKYSFSRFTISLLLLLINLLISSVLLFSIINYKDIVLKYSNDNPLVVYIVSSVLLLSYFTSIRFLFDLKPLRFNLINFFYNIIIPQYIAISILFNFGVLGNPNYKTKHFLKDDVVSSIVNTNTIYLFNVDSKIQTLLSYYLPSSKVVDDIEQIRNYQYLITSNTNSFLKLDSTKFFRPIKKFDNHLLLININH
tara:strand:- start:641 stop:1681 length:1041 start_codon:yes stop_codon:yes gene_type:complete